MQTTEPDLRAKALQLELSGQHGLERDKEMRRLAPPVNWEAIAHDGAEKIAAIWNAAPGKLEGNHSFMFQLYIEAQNLRSLGCASNCPIVEKSLSPHFRLAIPWLLLFCILLHPHGMHWLADKVWFKQPGFYMAYPEPDPPYPFQRISFIDGRDTGIIMVVAPFYDTNYYR